MVRTSIEVLRTVNGSSSDVGRQNASTGELFGRGIEFVKSYGGYAWLKAQDLGFQYGLAKVVMNGVQAWDGDRLELHQEIVLCCLFSFMIQEGMARNRDHLAPMVHLAKSFGNLIGTLGNHAERDNAWVELRKGVHDARDGVRGIAAGMGTIASDPKKYGKIGYNSVINGMWHMTNLMLKDGIKVLYPSSALPDVGKSVVVGVSKRLYKVHGESIRKGQLGFGVFKEVGGAPKLIDAKKHPFMRGVNCLPGFKKDLLMGVVFGLVSYNFKPMASAIGMNDGTDRFFVKSFIRELLLPLMLISDKFLALVLFGLAWMVYENS